MRKRVSERRNIGIAGLFRKLEAPNHDQAQKDSILGYSKKKELPIIARDIYCFFMILEIDRERLIVKVNVKALEFDYFLAKNQFDILACIKKKKWLFQMTIQKCLKICSVL